MIFHIKVLVNSHSKAPYCIGNVYFRITNRGFSCDVISSQICNSLYTRPPCWLSLSMARYRKTQQNGPYFLFRSYHNTNYNRVARILAHTLGGNFKSFCEVNQKFKHFFFVFHYNAPYKKGVFH